ncbi:thiamine biosynthesis protein MoeB [Peribacillus cavernae]|uniref:Thiamine biosynthesis protein MoeB n=1 Tax=Peribacillus cavernae TaxID=1674310 RepID=A0A3S0UD25_9BACI|nr:ThiF family adenylyltransferase [Peribacillus cavernae]MDQ0220181.1 adenylyltransferase/sulfurtransferase [Peribacillus cavernae]RUQ28806.1 thiamine biosynthesis protein MoeB [Peribacillus cavernae]
MKGRYAKQELFLGKEGQSRLQHAHAIIIGAGALGSASAEMLARAGVGNITIVDRDYVEWSNLQRQQLYSEEDAKKKLPKAIAAKTRLEQLNSEIKINSIIADINGLNIEELLKDISVIIDATDNFETRLAVNDAAVKHNIPFIFGACVASYGLTFPIIPEKTPCLHCLLNHLPAEGMTCDTVGVISPIVQIIAAFQVTNVLQLLTGQELLPIIQSFDIWKNEKAEINIQGLKNNDCPTCGEQATFPYLSFENQTKADVLCGRDAIQLRPGTSRLIQLESLSEHLKGSVSHIVLNPYLLSCSFEEYRIVLFKDGRAIIHGTNEPSKARAIYNRIIQ